jgi:thiol-disulfide isomerase/thioredoxin
MMILNRDNVSALVTGIAVIALIVGFAIYFNSPALNSASSGGNGANFVSNVAVDSASGKITKIQYSIDKSQFRKAPEFMDVSGYINTSPITLKDLKGKVVLVDFWTYSCINCIRTLPYLVDWNAKYADKGLVIVGVHTPEFEFEKNIENVKAAVQKFGIKYPVFQDNDKGTWNAYDNRYWPRKYIIDSEGYIRYDHIGEGGYAETEKVIQTLLAERAALRGAQTLDINSSALSSPANIQSVDFSKVNSPELYFGYQFARDVLGSPEGFKPDQVVNYSIPSSDLKANVIYLQGEWKNNPDNLELAGDSGKIALAYSAKSVNIVAGGSGQAKVSEDGIQSVSANSTNSTRGSDLDSGGTVSIDGQRLYNIATHPNYGNHYIVLDVMGKGFQAYTFTFG